jgi:hypothetical protein
MTVRDCPTVGLGPAAWLSSSCPARRWRWRRSERTARSRAALAAHGWFRVTWAGRSSHTRSTGFPSGRDGGRPGNRRRPAAGASAPAAGPPVGRRSWSRMTGSTRAVGSWGDHCANDVPNRPAFVCIPATPRRGPGRTSRAPARARCACGPGGATSGGGPEPIPASPRWGVRGLAPASAYPATARRGRPATRRRKRLRRRALAPADPGPEPVGPGRPRRARRRAQARRRGAPGTRTPGGRPRVSTSRARPGRSPPAVRRRPGASARGPGGHAAFVPLGAAVVCAAVPPRDRAWCAAAPGHAGDGIAMDVPDGRCRPRGAAAAAMDDQQPAGCEAGAGTAAPPTAPPRRDGATDLGNKSRPGDCLLWAGRPG